MAERTPEPTYTNPEVRFERTDITAGKVLEIGAYLAGGVVLVVLTMLWYGRVLQAQHRKPDTLDLPIASSDDDRLPPEPRLEAMEDETARMFPPRAADYYKPQRGQLKAGGGKILPIETAMDMVSNSLPVRESKDKAAPKSFTIRLPSKASSGQSQTGGQ